MGLFGFGSKKDKTPAASANDTYSLTGPAGPSSTQCILVAGLRGIEINADLSGTGTVTMTHGPVTVVGVNAIETYLDVKGQGAQLKPKKARHLGDQNRWIQVANQYLDTGAKIDEVLNHMNTLLGEQEFLAGPLSLADAHVAASVLSLKKEGKCPSGLNNVDAWLKRVEGKIPENLRSACMSHTS
jgi:hypothetical protein